MTTPPSASNTYDRYDDEISLAELFKILLQRKWLILGGSLTCALIVGMYTYLLPRHYQSEALVLISPSIIKQGSSDGDDSAQVSEIIVSSLEASTYKILAKSDELMLALADTLRARLTPELLEEIANETDSYTLASELTKALQVELLVDTGKRNVFSTTPLLVLRYKSAEESLPTIVVNTWSELFLQRNQGLSSNVTDDFYRNVVSQYKQAKDNLERKEDELAKVDAASNDLNRIKTEMAFKSTQLDTSLKAYQKAETDLRQKQREFDYTTSILQELEFSGRWIGYMSTVSIENITDKGSSIGDLARLVNHIESLRADSALIDAESERLFNDLNSDHELLKLEFETSTNALAKKEEIFHIDTLTTSIRREILSSKRQIDSLKLEVRSLDKVRHAQAPVLTTSKSITDGALWEGIQSNGQIDKKIQQALGKYRLISQETNPVYLSLSQSLANTKAQLYFKESRMDSLTKDVKQLEKRSIQLSKELLPLRKQEKIIERKIAAERNNLQRERERLMADVQLQLHIAKVAFEQYRKQYEKFKIREENLRRELIEMNQLTVYNKKNYATWREQLTYLSVKFDSLELERRRIERDVSVYQESFNRFSKLQEEARIAQRQAAGDVQIVSKAVLANRVPKNKVYIILSWVTGLLITAFYALAIELFNLRKIENDN